MQFLPSVMEERDLGSWTYQTQGDKASSRLEKHLIHQKTESSKTAKCVLQEGERWQDWMLQVFECDIQWVDSFLDPGS